MLTGFISNRRSITRSPVALIQVAGGLIGEQQSRPGHKGAPDRDALLFTAREVLRIVVQTPPEAHAREQVPGGPARESR